MNPKKEQCKEQAHLWDFVKEVFRADVETEDDFFELEHLPHQKCHDEDEVHAKRDDIYYHDVDIL